VEREGVGCGEPEKSKEDSHDEKGCQSRVSTDEEKSKPRHLGDEREERSKPGLLLRSNLIRRINGLEGGL